LRPAELLKNLKARDIELVVREGKLVCRAPKGAMTADLAEQIRIHKPVLLDLLTHLSESHPASVNTIERVGPEQRLALTSAQESLLFRQQLEPESGFLTLSGAWRLSGPLDLERLRRSINRFYHRHEILGATVAVDSSGGYFRLGDQKDIDVPLIKLATHGGKDTHSVLVEYLERQAKVCLDLESGPLFQVQIISLPEQSHVLFILAHHIVWDGWSFDLFLKELDLSYRTLANCEAPDPERLPLRYFDYAIWLRNVMASTDSERRLERMARSLSDYSNHIELPLDKPRPPLFTFTGSTVPFELPTELSSQIEPFCARYNITPFMLLLAVFKYVLYRYSRDQDIAIGSHIQNRTRPELEDIVGFFVNTLVLRTKIEPHSSGVELIKAVRKTCIDAYDDRHMPIELLVRKLGITPDPSNLPLVQIFFSYQDASNRRTSIGDLECRSVIRRAQNVDADLTLWVRNFGDRFDGGFNYRTDLYKEATIRSLSASFKIALAALIENPDRELAEIPCITAEQTADQLAKWSQQDEPYPDGGVYALIANQVDRTPGRMAVSSGSQRLTYAELDVKVAALAMKLISEGVEKGTVTGVHMERSCDLLISLLAVLRIGGIYLPLDPHLPQDRLRYISEDAGAEFLLTDVSEVPEWVPSNIAIVDATQSSKGKGLGLAGRDVEGRDPAYMIYTSGSTGLPKGVVVSHGNAVNFLCSMAKLPGITAADKLLAVTTYAFDISVLELFLPLTVGAEVVIASSDEARDGHGIIAVLEQHDITVMQSTPATWRMLIALGWLGKANLTALCGGEPLTPKLCTDLLPRVTALYNMYGPTETTVWSSVYAVEKPQAEIPLGRPIANTQLYVLSDMLQPLPQGALGELYIGGAGVALGYHNRADLTREKFVKSPFVPDQVIYRTGDLVRIGGNGQLIFKGRLDDQIKVRGYRIELGEVESALRSLDSVAAAAVKLQSLSDTDQRLIAYVVAERDSHISQIQLRKQLRETLPDYMIPQHFITLDGLPLLPSGKVNRKALPETEFNNERSSFEPPVGATEQALAELIAQAIGIERIDRRDNFFELGGHSLLAIQVIAVVRDRFRVLLSPGAFLLDSLQQIAREIERLGGNDANADGVDEEALPPHPQAQRGLFANLRSWFAD
jgi:amino acid adenylation domain-containing protein